MDLFWRVHVLVYDTSRKCNIGSGVRRIISFPTNLGYLSLSIGFSISSFFLLASISVTRFAFEYVDFKEEIDYVFSLRYTNFSFRSCNLNSLEVPHFSQILDL